MIAGITVLPARSTRLAPAGACTSPALPTCVSLLPSTTNVALSMVCPSPTMSRAPSNTVAVDAGCLAACSGDDDEHAESDESGEK